MFLKISPIKGVIRFGKANMIAPRYVGPFKILERIGSIANRVELLERLSGVHNVFHVSHLRKYVHDPTEIFEPTIHEYLEVEPNLTIIRHPVCNVDRDEK